MTSVLIALHIYYVLLYVFICLFQSPSLILDGPETTLTASLNIVKIILCYAPLYTPLFQKLKIEL